MLETPWPTFPGTASDSMARIDGVLDYAIRHGGKKMRDDLIDGEQEWFYWIGRACM